MGAAVFLGSDGTALTGQLNLAVVAAVFVAGASLEDLRASGTRVVTEPALMACLTARMAVDGAEVTNEIVVCFEHREPHRTY